MGRFAQADTDVPASQGIQAFDRYAYVNNSPLRYTDPTGHYGEDVHDDLTYQLALDVGLNEDLATDIAAANQGVDENRSTWPINTKESDELGGISPSEYYHFETKEVAEQRLEQAIIDGDAEAFGAALHTLQDSYSHIQSGFSFNSGNAGVYELLEKCHECFTGEGYVNSDWDPNKTARLLGHGNGETKSKVAWNHIWGQNPYSSTDNYDPVNSARDRDMRDATEYWLDQFFLYNFGMEYLNYHSGNQKVK